MNSIEISFHDLLWALKKHIIWILLATLVCAVGAFGYTRYFTTPVYSTRVSFCVFAKNRDPASAGVTSGELSADATIANTYAILLTSDPVCEAVSEALGGKVAAGTVSGMLSSSRPSNSQVVYATITSTDPKLVVEVGNTLLEVAPDCLSEIVRGGEMTAVDSAKYAGQISPNMTTNVTYGALIGLLASCALVVIFAMLDTTIWKEDDLERAFDIPVLGSVPSMLASEQAKIQKSRR